MSDPRRVLLRLAASRRKRSVLCVTVTAAGDPLELDGVPLAAGGDVTVRSRLLARVVSTQTFVVLPDNGREGSLRVPLPDFAAELRGKLTERGVPLTVEEMRDRLSNWPHSGSADYV